MAFTTQLMRTPKGFSIQQRYEVHAFLERLKFGQVTTLEVAQFLIILREHKPGPVLLDWCDGVAHKARTRGDVHRTGLELMAEILRAERFLKMKVSIRRIPCELFDLVCTFIENDRFDLGRTRTIKTDQLIYSSEELLASVRHAYQLDPSENVYRLTYKRTKQWEDSVYFETLLSAAKSIAWGASPILFVSVFDEVIEQTARLVGVSGAKTLKTHRDLFTVHFLCCFHLTELRGSRGIDPKYPCFLGLDETASGKLALSLALYERASIGWDQVRLPHEDRGDDYSGSHAYARPYLVTDLPVLDYFDGELIASKYRDAPFLNPMAVGVDEDGPFIFRGTKIKAGHPRKI